MRKVLKALHIIQTYHNTDRHGINKEAMKGRGYMKAYRLNPYNPLSYIFLVLAAVVGILMFGFVGIWDQMDNRNPFKWN